MEQLSTLRSSRRFSEFARIPRVPTDVEDIQLREEAEKAEATTIQTEFSPRRSNIVEQGSTSQTWDESARGQSRFWCRPPTGCLRFFSRQQNTLPLAPMLYDPGYGFLRVRRRFGFWQTATDRNIATNQTTSANVQPHAVSLRVLLCFFVFFLSFL